VLVVSGCSCALPSSTTRQSAARQRETAQAHRARAERLAGDVKELRAYLALVGANTEEAPKDYLTSAVRDFGRPRLALVIGNAAYR
jgi:hypothetical protein